MPNLQNVNQGMHNVNPNIAHLQLQNYIYQLQQVQQQFQQQPGFINPGSTQQIGTPSMQVQQQAPPSNDALLNQIN